MLASEGNLNDSSLRPTSAALREVNGKRIKCNARLAAGRVGSGRRGNRYRCGGV